jgi:metacaspase-1
MRCSVILIAGCQDSQFSADIGTNGLFTLMLKQVWNEGAFNGTHPNFFEQIRTAVQEEYSSQVPAYYSVKGNENAFREFELQRPYLVQVQHAGTGGSQ